MYCTSKKPEEQMADKNLKVFFEFWLSSIFINQVRGLHDHEIIEHFLSHLANLL